MFLCRTRTEDIEIRWEHLYCKDGYCYYRFYFSGMGSWHFHHLKLIERKCGKKKKFHIPYESESSTMVVTVLHGSNCSFYFVFKDWFGYTHKRFKITSPSKKDGKKKEEKELFEVS